jgi:hypothetical protein
MKHFLFLDESGDHGLVNVDPAFPVFVLCGIILSELQYQAVIQKMQGIKKRFWGDRSSVGRLDRLSGCEVCAGLQTGKSRIRCACGEDLYQERATVWTKGVSIKATSPPKRA